MGAEGAAAGATYGGEGATYGGGGEAAGATYGGEAGAYGSPSLYGAEGAAGADYYGTGIPATQQGGGAMYASLAGTSMTDMGGAAPYDPLTGTMDWGGSERTDMTGGRYFGGSDVPPEQAFERNVPTGSQATLSQGLLSSKGFDWGKFWKQFGEGMLRGGGKKGGRGGTAMVGNPPDAPGFSVQAPALPAQGGGGQRPASPATQAAPSGFIPPRQRQGFAAAVQAAFGGR